MLIAGTATPSERCELSGEVPGEPRGDLAAERLVFFAESQVHGDPILGSS
jgi:hypothetical protein